MPNSDIRQSIHDILHDLRGLDGLKQLFWSELSYERVNQALPRRGWADAATSALAENPLLFAAGGNREDFHVLYARLDSDKLPLGLERPVISALLNEHPYALFVFSNARQDHWHFVNVKYDTDVARRKIYRRIVVGPHERLRTATERITMLDVQAIQKNLLGRDALAIQTAHDDAFDVEAVTEQFFGHYQVVFDQLQKDLRKQTRDAQWAHDFAQQFLNRLMFLYFIQRKRWLADDPDFICNFWDTYKKSSAPKDSFYRDWLAVLFFEAFNNQFQAGRTDRAHLPKNYRDVLALAPYLNGGLFAENGLDGKYSVKIGDDIFVALFDRFDHQAPGFFERYNFTIREDSPFDQEVAVDPEMIGKVYESLVNVTSEGVEETDQRGSAGIFYTPRIEIDLMCRLTLVDYLANHLGEKFKSLIYQAVFAYDDADKQAADQAIAKANVWGSLNERLRKLTVCDPACGSGSFIVGMLMALDDLQARANKQLQIAETMYQRRKRIIGQSLYGVDVKDWAVRTAELRLWLQLIVETDLDVAEMKMQPLLPNLSFKLRVGDSLVQQVGGIIFNVDHAHSIIPAPLKRKLTALKDEKLKFYNDVRASKFKSEDAVKNEELNIFREILDARADELDKRVRELKREMDKPPEQMRLLGMEKPRAAEQLDLFLKSKRQDLEAAQEELAQVQAARAALRATQAVPFVWDIAFVEIFEDDEKGFGIVIGNPPYVRQEMIADPLLREEDYKPDAWREKKKEYKAQLQQAVAEAFPKFFHYKHGSDKFRKLNGKSDLYIYFYLLGLKRLNAQGSFCFITSNSWLDVGYGKDLQEFLLTQAHVKMILDNSAKRSFKQADVNTIIALLAPPHPERSREAAESKDARFVMFRTPFENVLSPVVFQEIEQAHERTSTPEFRVTPIRQRDLLAEGMAMAEDDEGTQKRGLATASYEGGKWGGRYLRAPDIFFMLLEKGKTLLAPMSDYFDGERYLNTGGADGFFILTDVAEQDNGLYRVCNAETANERGELFEGTIEADYLIPLIKDVTKKDKRIEIQSHDAYCLVVKGKPSPRLKKYIAWGENQGYDKRSVTKNQHPWYKPTNQMLNSSRILVPRSFNDTFVIYYNPKGYLSLRFYRLHAKRSKDVQLVAFLNSTLIAFVLETLGNKNLGQGVLDFFMADFLALHLPMVQNAELESAFRKMGKREMKSIVSEVAQQDRRALDDVIFDALKLTRGERDAVYEAVVELVRKRLEKAGSV